MKVLLDTHAFLWWITDDHRLSARARDVISDGANHIYVSAASGWEIAIKAQIGKLSLPREPGGFVREQMTANSFAALPVRMEHALQVYDLPTCHRDPFDRLLICQSRMEGAPLLSADSVFGDYDVEVIW